MTHPDPEIARYEAERELRDQKKQEARRADEKPILDRLKEQGVEVEKIWDLETLGTLNEAIVEILLDGLSEVKREDTCNSIIQTLFHAAEPFDGRPLLKFVKYKADPLENAVLNTIIATNPHSIDDWLEMARQDEYYHRILHNFGYRW